MDRIFSYIDYRAYLKDFYEEKKSTTTFFSYRWFAQKAELSSPVFLKRVMEGDRSLTPATLEKFIVGLGLEEKEAEYFRVLVAFNQSKTAIEKQKNYAIMLSMVDFVKNHQLEADQYSYFDNWYTPVIRELVCMKEYGDDYSALAMDVVPPINRREAHESILLLERMELITRDESGKYIQTEPAVTSGNGQSPMLKLARKAFHEQVIKLAGRSLTESDPKDRHAVSITMGISRACYDVLVQEISRFQERVVAIVDNDHASEQVFQMNMHLFNVSTPQPSSESPEEEEC